MQLFHRRRGNTAHRQLLNSTITASLLGIMIAMFPATSVYAQDTQPTKPSDTPEKPTNFVLKKLDENTEGGSEIPLEDKDLDTPEKMLAEINRLTDLINKNLLSVPGQKHRILGTEYNDPLMQRQRLIWRYYEKNPADEYIATLMDERWRIMTTKLRREGFVMSETIEVMKNDNASADVKRFAKYWRTYSSIKSTIRSPSSQPAQLKKQVDKFISQYPDDPRGASLLGFIANRLVNFPDDQLKWYRRLGKEYPETFMGRIGAGKARQVDDIGKPFSLEFDDLSTGNHYTMDDFKGKVVVIDFMATFCKPCMKELPDFMNLQKSLADKGVVFIAVSLDRIEDRGGKKAIQGMIDETGLDWPVYYEGNGFQSDFSQDWGINSIPIQFVIDQNGILRSSKAGNALEAIIHGLLKDTNSVKPGDAPKDEK